MGVETPGHPGEKGRNQKGIELQALRVHRGEVGGHFVFPDGRDAPAEVGVNQVAQRQQGDQDPGHHPEEAGEAGHTQITPGAAQGVDVLQDALDDHVEGEGDDGQVVAPGAEGGIGHDEAGRGRGQAAGHQAPPESTRRQGRGAGPPPSGWRRRRRRCP